MYVESFHNRLKTRYMQRRPNRRLDDLVNLLLEIEQDDFNRWCRSVALNEVYTSNSYNTENRHERGLKISDEQVFCIQEDTMWHIQSQSIKEKLYVVRRLTDICMDDHCMDGCHNLSCCGLCMHLFHCSCLDRSRLCKHIHKVQSIHMRFKRQDTSDEPITSSQPFKLHTASESNDIQTLDINTDVLLERVQSKCSQLHTLLESGNIHPSLLPHIDGVLSNILKQCEALHPSSTQSVPPMQHTTFLNPAEKIPVQIPSMKRLSKSKVANMLPKIDHEVAEEAKESLLEQRACATNPESNNLDVLSNKRNKLKLIKLSQDTVVEPSVLTIPSTFSDDVNAVVLKWTDTYKLSLLHIKSLESSLPRNVYSILHASDPSFRTGWIYDMIIDAFMFRLTQVHRHVWFADSVVASALMNGCGTRRTWLGDDLSGKTVVFFPCNLAGNHWVLYVVDTVRRVVTYLNPMKTTMGHLELKMIECIKQLIDSKFPNSYNNKWSNPEEPPHARQQDSMNCGVFTMWYAQQIAEHKSLEGEFDTDAMRRSIFLTLAGNCLRRDSIKDETCGICRNREQFKDWVLCDQCLQWHHDRCIEVPVKLARDPSFKFICGNYIK